MKRAVQKTLLGLADAALRRGLLKSRIGRAFFEFAYQRYKAWLEAPAIDHLSRLVGPGAWVVDVGANTGFFSRRFAAWVREGGRVIAIEPAPDNLARLEANLARWGLAEKVIVVGAAAADSEGEVHLVLDPGNPADHRLGAEGLVVRSVTLDSLLGKFGAPPVALIKIDVQGAEPLVLAGARATLARARPSLFIEVSEQVEAVTGRPRGEMIHALLEDGYSAHTVAARGISPALTHAEIDRLIANEWYVDFLIMPASSG